MPSTNAFEPSSRIRIAHFGGETGIEGRVRESGIFVGRAACPTWFNHRSTRLVDLHGEKGIWRLAWMKRDLKWHDLEGDEYRGAFDECLRTIVEDPDCTFWG